MDNIYIYIGITLCFNKIWIINKSVGTNLYLYSYMFLLGLLFSNKLEWLIKIVYKNKAIEYCIVNWIKFTYILIIFSKKYVIIEIYRA